jgi:molybdopterin/thiamine biosynthesis adenylyltransferase
MDRSRFVDLTDVGVLSNEKMLMVGLGSVGSNLARAAASIGITSFVLFDADVVGRENIAVSWLEGEGEQKSEDVAGRLSDRYGVDVLSYPRLATGNAVQDTISDEEVTIVVVSTDNIDSRREVYESIASLPGTNDLLFIDFRIGGYNGHVFSFFMGDNKARAAYEKTLNNRGIGLPCGAKAYPGLTLGWCPMTLIDILSRFSKGETFHYNRSVYMDVTQGQIESVFAGL